MTGAATSVDLERYPIDRLEDEGTWVGDLRARLDEKGILELPDFLRPEAVVAMRAEARAVADRAYFCEHRHNVYLTEDDPALPSDHPRNRKVLTNKGNVAMDRIPSDGPLRRLYDWAPLRDFIARAQGVPKLYPYGDPLAALMINVNRPGETLGWHYDNSDFAVTLMIDPGEAGGGFEYVYNSRAKEAVEATRVSAILDGERSNITVTHPAPGTLTIFRGRQSLHRVTPTAGATSRLVGVLSYAEQPNVTMSAYAQELFHGRVAS